MSIRAGRGAAAPAFYPSDKWEVTNLIHHLICYLSPLFPPHWNRRIVIIYTEAGIIQI